MNETTDSQLICRILNGEPHLYGALVERYQCRLVRSLSVSRGNTHDALDLAQEAFLLAYQNLHTFRSDAAFYSWLYRIALNVGASQSRRKRPATSLEQVREATGNEPMDHQASANPTFAMEQADRQRLLHEALNSMTEEYRIPLVLKEIDGLSYEQIAVATESPIGTVRSRIHRAREELRQKLWPRLSAEFA